jgi:DNA polymerase-1
MAKVKKPLVLLDAHAILHRAYHALPDFSSSKGEPTGALYGVVAMLLKIVEDLSPEYIVACFDLPQATYRHEVYKEYKAGRAKMDSELATQINRSRDLFAAFSIPIYDKPGFEADDILGTIAEEIKTGKAKKSADLDVIIASGDMDTLQLVDDDRVRVYTLRKGIKDTILYNEKGVKERFGFGPELLPDYKGLRGDPSDNIIGIKGIGEKTATTLIVEFGTIEKMYARLKKDPAKFEEEAKKIGITPRIVKLLQDNEEEALFSKMLATIRRNAPIEFVLPEKSWRETLDLKAVDAICAELEFRTLPARVRAVLGEKSGGEKDTENTTENKAEKMPDQNIDPAELKETALALWLVDSAVSNPELADILQFAKTDSFAKAREIILAELKKRNLEMVFNEIEKPLIPILAAMHDRGIAIDAGYLKKLSKEYHSELEKLQKNIWRMVGAAGGDTGEFNINSPRQLGDVLFNKLNLKAKNQKKTDGGALSTRESELEKMRDLHPVIPLILEYRQFQKLLSTYIDTIPNMLAEDGRLHTTFVQTGASTGRMSSQDPNLQNIPIKTELGRRIRTAFVAAPGYELVSFDYSQIELRIAAILSGDERLMDIFKTGRDVHTEVAAQVFKVPPEKVDREMRRKAKVINFGILYGMGVNALRQNLGGTRSEAQMFYQEYFSTFTGLAGYLDQVKAEAERKGYTETLFGRRRYFEGIRSKIPYVKAAAERMAINAPIQGTQADIIKLAMIKINEYIEDSFGKSADPKIHLLLQVHDELIYEVPEVLVAQIAPKIKDIMQSVLPPEKAAGVPILANGHAGKNWGDMIDI